MSAANMTHNTLRTLIQATALLLCFIATAQAAVTATLTSPLSNTTVTAPGSFVLTATATSSNSTIKSVAFYNGSKLLKSVTAAPYTYTWSNVAKGSYSLTAKATDKKNATKTSTAVSVKVVANVPPTVSLTSPSANASATAPGSFALSATAASTTSTISKVDFYNGTTLIGTATTGTAGVYSFTWSNVAAGTYSLTAKATDAKNAVTTTTAIPVSVVNANVPPTVGLTSPAPNTESTAPATIMLSANATDSDGSISKVEFFNGTTLLGTATAAPYSYIWVNVAAGNYNLTALATDNTGTNTTSTVINVTVNQGEPQVYYIHTDHLDTPREITDTNGNVVWRWDNTDPFGDNLPDENPSGLGQFEFNLRFPGQYYDKETNLNYNINRDYDPGTGRYVQSDPIGLDGVSFSTYTYVEGNPLSRVDPFGLFEITVNDPGGRNGATYGGTITVTGDNGQTVTVPGSSWPNPSNPSPGIQPGSYTGTYSPTGHHWTTNGIQVNNNGPVPTMGPNPAQGGNSFATQIHMHCGDSATNRGSAGCPTISPSSCQQVWSVLQPGETGTIQINR